MIFLRFKLLRVNSSNNPVEPLNSFPLIVISLSVSTSSVESPILNESPSFLIPYLVSRWRRRRLESYGNIYGLAMGLSNACVSPFTKSSSPSSSSSLISPIVNLGLGVFYSAEVEGMATGSVCVPTSKWSDGRSGGGDGGGCFFLFFFASVSVGGRMRFLVRLSVENPRSPSYTICV